MVDNTCDGVHYAISFFERAVSLLRSRWSAAIIPVITAHSRGSVSILREVQKEIHERPRDST